MIESLFIMSQETKEVLIEKHWGTINDRSMCHTFWAEAKEVPNIHEVPSTIVAASHYLFHYKCDGVILLCCCSEEMPPLLAMEFMTRCCEVFADYFGDSKERTLRAHFVTVYQLLEEMCDSGIPLTTEPNILKEMIAPPNILNRLASTISGTKGVVVSNQLPDGMQSNIPWRRANVKYASNEIFFDIVEEFDMTIDNNGRTVDGGISGEVTVNCRLSGNPDVTLTFQNPQVLDDARLHPCVRYARYAADRSVSFVPPDGQFKLMNYRIKTTMGKSSGPKTLQLPTLPLYVKPQISYSEGSGRMNIMVGPKADLGKPPEEIVVHIPLPKSVLSADLQCNHGTVAMDIGKKTAAWNLGKLPKDKTPMLTGNLKLSVPKATPGEAPADAKPKGKKIGVSSDCDM